MRVFHGRRVMVGALAVVLTAIVAAPPAVGNAAVRTASLAPSVASDLAAQKIWFKPALTGTVGDATTLSAAADSQLPVTFKSADLDRCKVDGTTLTFTKLGNCRVIASQAGDGINWGPAPDVIVAIAVSRGYHAKATASRDGVVRTDGAIQVGDVLAVSLTAADTAVTACTFAVLTAGGWLMQGDGAAHPDGSCSLWTVVPKPTDPVSRSERPGTDDLDLCVSIVAKTFADKSKRVMASSDRKTPGGSGCNNGVDRNEDQVLDFTFDGTGKPAKFASSPKLLSWNPADWNASYVPFQYNTDWHIAFPSWVRTCEGPYLNAGWGTVYASKGSGPGCPDWSMHVPGMLPRAMPWDGGPATAGGLTSADIDILIRYTNDLGKPGQTVITQTIPYAPSDGDFRSSFPAISPMDIAKDRYVQVGDAWHPTFRVSGVAQAVACQLQLHAPGEGQVAEYSAPVDAATGACEFDVPAFAKVGAYTQYSVSFTRPETDGRSSSFGAGITAVAPLTPPTIPDARIHANGTTTVAANPGAGDAMSLEMSVTRAGPTNNKPWRHSLGVRGADSKAVAAADMTVLCSAVSFTFAPPRPSPLLPASSVCALPPGAYVVTARLVEATGVVTTINRTITIDLSKVEPSTHGV